ncbi:EmrB/QacA subfamily drug resistance transporter [Terracoccus luteus]|uniref:EmrB/QacA subfamily drug resistance transporter n=1 Tax=Terracoccus luteus TaxID=53356 RepID=A0A495XRD2_9MICO|nr:DHA2 family efflux MFS transporter permease subunit [Terracoccus luteus]RKT77060.1 EmrB/QacA subfamily drug resistance transporter [Terracoccus luteus]
MSSTTVEELNEPTRSAGSDTAGPKRLGLALLVICAAQLMIVLDGTIVNIALPHIERDLGFSQANLQWVITIYTLAFGGVLLLGGRLGDLYGRRRMFVWGVVLFTVSSLAAGIAQNEQTMLVARAVQGLGGALAAPNALALITTTFPAGKERNKAMGVFAAMSGAGAAIGLILGGALTEIDWRWNFFINLPIGLVVAVLGQRILTESEDGQGSLDVPGAITSIAGLSSLVYGLTHAASTSWGDATTVGFLVAGVVLLAAFVVIETRVSHPLLPMRIPGDRTRGTSNFVMLVVGAGMFAMFYFLGIYIQTILGYSALKTGLAFLPFSVGIVVAAQVASLLVSRVDPRWISGPGAAFAAVGMWGFTHLTPQSTYTADLLPWIVVLAFGLGLIFVPMTLTAVHAVDHEDSSSASAVLNTMQQVGGALGLATLSTIFVNNVADRVAQLTASAPTGGAAPTREQAAAAARAIQAEAFTYGAGRAYLVAAIMIAVAGVITVAFLTVKHDELANDVAAPAHMG